MRVKGTEEVTAENEPQVRESSGEGRIGSCLKGRKMPQF